MTSRSTDAPDGPVQNLAASNPIDSADSPSLLAIWIWPRFLLFPVLAIVAYPFFILGWGGTSWLATSLWVTSLTYCWFCVGGAFHEASHQTLFRSVAANIWYGRVLGWMIGIPYTVYRETHRRHHAYLNTPEDYELWPYCDPSCSLSFRRMFVWLDLLFGVVTAPYIYGRIYFLRDRRLSEKVRRVIFGEYLGQVGFWVLLGTLLAAIILSLETAPEFRFAWLLPLLCSPMLNTARKFVEHLGMTSSDPFLGTRTVIPRFWPERILSYFNFDIAVHGPHHRYPRAHHYELVGKYRVYEALHLEAQQTHFDSYLTAWTDVLRFLWSAPQTGEHIASQTCSAIVSDSRDDTWGESELEKE